MKLTGCTYAIDHISHIHYHEGLTQPVHEWLHFHTGFGLSCTLYLLVVLNEQPPKRGDFFKTKRLVVVDGDGSH